MSCVVIRIYPPCTAIVCRLDGRLQRTKLRSSLDIKPSCSGLAPGLAPGLARPKINAGSNETLPAVWSVVSRQLATLLHSDIQIQALWTVLRARNKTTSLGDKRFLLYSELNIFNAWLTKPLSIISLLLRPHEFLTLNKHWMTV